MLIASLAKNMELPSAGIMSTAPRQQQGDREFVGLCITLYKSFKKDSKGYQHFSLLLKRANIGKSAMKQCPWLPTRESRNSINSFYTGNSQSKWV